MANFRQKAPELLQFTRGGQGRRVVVTQGRPDGWKPPALPSAVTAPLADVAQAKLRPAALAYTRKIWEAWWRSQASKAVDLDTDANALDWWITCVFRREIYAAVAMQQPLVKGSMGQLVPNPLESVIRGLTADINRTQERFGMDTLSRFRLAIEDRTAESASRPSAISWDSVAVSGGDPLAALR